jgi:integrase
MGMIAKVPKFGRMAEADSKGRPITTEEFERMLDKVSTVVGEAAAPSWRRLLLGLWLSGLRLGEALALSWEADAPFRVDFSERRPCFRIEAEGQKNRKTQTCPMAPEFAEFLLATPEAERHGRVFRPMRPDGDDSPMRLDTASRVVCRIGKRAGVVVAKKGNGKVKYAAAHDLRRSFGDRWSKLVMPPVLMQLMRHSDIGTTMRFYVGRDSQATAEVLWALHKPAGTNTFPNSGPETANAEGNGNDATRCENAV